jgi:hypothetical protein
VSGLRSTRKARKLKTIVTIGFRKLKKQ